MYCSLVTDLEDELENAYNNGNIPMANVETAKTADMMKRAIAILTFGKELLGRKRETETVETKPGLYEGRKVTSLLSTCFAAYRHVPQTLLYLSMSLCPPFAPFFGFAGVASAVSGASFVVKENEFKLDCNRWSLAVCSLTSGL